MVLRPYRDGLKEMVTEVRPASIQAIPCEPIKQTDFAPSSGRIPPYGELDLGFGVILN